MDSEKRLTITIPEAAKLLGISRNLAYELAGRGEVAWTYTSGGKAHGFKSAPARKAIERGQQTRE